jgi:hypothetical protein
MANLITITDAEPHFSADARAGDDQRPDHDRRWEACRRHEVVC